MNKHTMKKAYILIGVPASGKSTWVEQTFMSDDDVAVISSDNVIDAVAAATGMTYNDVFQSVVGLATKVVEREFAAAIEREQTIVVDRTNMSRKSRANWIKGLKNAEYYVTAVKFTTPPKDEWEVRLNSRPGKNIPDYVLQTMKANYEEPTFDEGFDEII